MFSIIALNCVRLLTRILPYIFEEPDWRGFFWSQVPSKKQENKYSDSNDDKNVPLAQMLLQALVVRQLRIFFSC
jgi:hypothetical protein